MSRRRTTLTLAVAAALAVGAPAAADPGGCQAFGQNVGDLAQMLGGAFGDAASTVASSAPQAFPTLVVHPEQDALC